MKNRGLRYVLHFTWAQHQPILTSSQYSEKVGFASQSLEGTVPNVFGFGKKMTVM